MKRIGFVGLSTPIYYDYRNKAALTQADTSSSPNPIVEGAFGAMLLYDEIWFLTKSLCPENMRGLSYVRFLNEENQVPEVDPEWLPVASKIFQDSSIENFNRSPDDYERIKQENHIYWDAAADNHTHALRVGDVYLSGNSWNIKNVIFDLLVVERLPSNVELITNSFSSRLFKTESRINDQLKLTEVLVLNCVPQFISEKGPYHPCIEEVKDSTFLSHFRDWITTEAFDANAGEISEIKEEVEKKLAEEQRKVFLKHLDPKGGYTNLAETILSVGADELIPGSATVKELFGQLNHEKQIKGTRWQGFIVDARSKLP